MSPQPSNRKALLDGALRCLEESSSSRITARQIAAASGANLGSIQYHFGSTEALVGAAMAEGFRRWLEELAGEMGDVADASPIERIQLATKIVTAPSERRAGLVRAFLSALARAPHDDELRAALAKSYSDSRVEVAELLGLGDDEPAALAASFVLATFDGLLIQNILDVDNSINAENALAGIGRLAAVANPQQSQ